MFSPWRYARAPVTLLRNASAIAVPFSVSGAAGVKSQDDNKEKTFTASYLVDSCGLTPELAESISKKVSFEDSGNPDSVLNLLRSHGFTDTHISKMVRSYPRLLLANAEKTLLPKLELLWSRGVSNSELTEIVSKVPRILAKGSKSISPYYDFLKDIIIHDNDESPKEFHPSLAQGSQKNIVYNVSVLRKLGVPQRSLSSFFISHSKSFGAKERFEKSVKSVIEMGFDPTSAKFVHALRTVHEMADSTMEQKVAAYKRLGFSESEIWAAFKRWPLCLKVSEEKMTRNFEAFKRFGFSEHEIRAMFRVFPECFSCSEQKMSNMFELFLSLGFSRDEVAQIMKRQPSCIGFSAETMKEKTEFLVKMGWPLEAIAAQATVLVLSLEKRIIPRCNVIAFLKSKGLIKDEVRISCVLKTSEKVFLDMYVLKHREVVPELMDVFTAKVK